MSKAHFALQKKKLLNDASKCLISGHQFWVIRRHILGGMLLVTRFVEGPKEKLMSVP